MTPDGQDRESIARDELAQLVRTLHETQQRIRELTGGQVDAVIHPSGASYLLEDAQRLLRESEQVNRQQAFMMTGILNALPAHIALLDSGGTIIAVNEAWKRFAAANALASENFSVGENYIDVCDKAHGECSDEAKVVADGIRSVLAGEHDRFELEYPCHSSGEKRWFRVMVTPLEEAQIGGVVVTHINVTERKLAEEAVRESEQRYRRLFESNPNPMWVYDLETLKFLAVNDAAIAQYGYSRDEFMAMTIADIRPEEDVPALKEFIRNFRNEYGTAGVWRHRVKDGRILEVEVFWHTIDFAGRRAKLVSAIDLTSRLKAERELRDREALLSNAQRIGNMGSWMMDFRTNRLHWPPETLRLFGVTAEEFDNTAEFFGALILPEDRPVMEEVHRRSLGKLQPHEIEYRICRPDGQVRWMYERGDVEFAPNGTPLRRFGMVMDITARKEVEAELRRSEGLREIASRLGRLGGWEVQLPEYKVSWSEIVRQIHEAPEGYTPTLDEGINLYAPEWRDKVREVFMKCALDGVPFDIEVEIISMSGNRVWARVMGEAVRDARGKITRVHGAFQDISERKQIEEKVRQKDALLRIAGKVARVGGWEVGKPDNKVYWSDEIFDILEYPRGSPPPFEEALSFYAEESRQPVVDALRACLDNGVPFDIEVQVRTTSGKVIWVECSGEAERNEKGEIVRAIGAFQDISKEVEIREALSQSEERFRYVTRATVDAIWDWNLVTDAVWWNDAIHTTFGYGTGELEPDSRSWTNRIHPDDKEGVVNSIHSAIDGESDIWEEKYRFRRRDGTYARVVDRGFVIRDTARKAIRMVGGMTDITNQVALEDQLRQAQRLESVGQLTGGIAHDFNNLLTVILGNSELLMEELAEQSDLHAFAEMILQAAEQGAELTHRLLAFARRQPLNPRRVDVDRLVRGLDKLLRRTLGEHIEIHFLLHHGLWQAMVDPAQLESALLNLCINARDAMPDGGRLTIEVDNGVIDENYPGRDSEVRAGDFVVLVVSDTGTGIPPDALPRVFEPFYTTKREGKGSGLGLSMVYGFVKQSRGHIRIYSEPGVGTTVKIFLPRATDIDERVSSSIEQTAVTGGGETILLVEDEELVRRFAMEQLQVLGYKVMTAVNGPDALEIVQGRDDIDLLFTDVVMPGGMNGKQLADAARETRPGLRVLYTSGYTEDAIMHHGRLDPGALLLSKPYGRVDLARKIRQALESS